MTQMIPCPTEAPASLDCDRLDCYRVAIEFQVLAARLASHPRLGALRDQLDRASVSIVLNLAEGAGRRTERDKAHFLTIARGSATECAAILDLLVARGWVAPSDHRHGRGLLIRVVQMLTRLVARVASTVERGHSSNWRPPCGSDTGTPAGGWPSKAGGVNGRKPSRDSTRARDRGRARP